MSINRISKLFETKKDNILSIFCTAGFPELNSLPNILIELQNAGVDMVEIGIPFSDPIADGPTIQQSNKIALDNGMTIKFLFEQLKNVRTYIDMPLILMGYFNPVLQYGVEHFLRDAQTIGIDGVIIPDLPLYEYETYYKRTFEQYDIKNIFLITPQTSTERVQKIDAVRSAFLYLVSSNSVTGSTGTLAKNEEYYERIWTLQLKNPSLIGFGIHDKSTFDYACSHANGAIIGSAFIKALQQEKPLQNTIQEFILSLKADESSYHKL